MNAAITAREQLRAHRPGRMAEAFRRWERFRVVRANTSSLRESRMFSRPTQVAVYRQSAVSRVVVAGSPVVSRVFVLACGFAGVLSPVSGQSAGSAPCVPAARRAFSPNRGPLIRRSEGGDAPPKGSKELRATTAVCFTGAV
jgi:threonine dehydrogenase-like Zn-dependent dehydrogenase